MLKKNLIFNKNTVMHYSNTSKSCRNELLSTALAESLRLHDYRYAAPSVRVVHSKKEEFFSGQLFCLSKAKTGKAFLMLRRPRLSLPQPGWKDSSNTKQQSSGASLGLGRALVCVHKAPSLDQRNHGLQF